MELQPPTDSKITQLLFSFWCSSSIYPFRSPFSKHGRVRHRARILQGAGDTIFKLMLDRSMPRQWAEWLRVPLEYAAGSANYDLVKKLLKAGADCGVGCKGCHGKTLLHAAAEGGDGQVVTELIRAGAGADKNTKSSYTGRTPLMLRFSVGRRLPRRRWYLPEQICTSSTTRRTPRCTWG